MIRLSVPLFALFLLSCGTISPAWASGVQMAASTHILWLKADGTVWAAGEQNEGARGDNAQPKIRKAYKKIAGVDGATAIAARESTSAALLRDGKVLVWGSYNYMQPYHQPKFLPGLDQVQQFSLGDRFVVALKKDGSVWFMGNDSHGLGAGEADTVHRAVKINGLADAVGVGATTWAAFAVLKDGSVWGWGSGFGNLLGKNGKWDFFAPTEDANPKPLRIAGLSKVVALSGGHFHMLALTSDGEVYSWGNNEDGQLGQPLIKGIGGTAYQMPARVQGLPKIKAIASGYDFSMALDLQGQVWVWGANCHGTLGVSDKAEDSRFVPQMLRGINNAVSIHPGNYHGFAVLADDSVMGWGENGADFAPFTSAVGGKQIPPTLVK